MKLTSFNIRIIDDQGEARMLQIGSWAGKEPLSIDVYVVSPSVPGRFIHSHRASNEEIQEYLRLLTDFLSSY